MAVPARPRQPVFERLNMHLPRELMNKKLDSVCFFCQARLPASMQGKTWKKTVAPNKSIVASCNKHLHDMK